MKLPHAMALALLSLLLTGCPAARQPSPAESKKSRVAAAPKPVGPSEKALVEALRANKPPQDNDPRFAQAIQRIDQLRGQLEFDAAGQLVGVDLASDRLAVSDDDVARLAALPHLARLKVSGGEITNRGVRQISRLTGLTELAIEKSQIDNAGLGELTALARLKSLNLRGSINLTDDGLDHLRQFPRLTSLALLDNKTITDAGIARLKPLVGLRFLDLRGCARVSDQGLADLRALKNLRSLRLGGDLVTDATMAVVEDLASLESLTVEA